MPRHILGLEDLPILHPKFDNRKPLCGMRYSPTDESALSKIWMGYLFNLTWEGAEASHFIGSYDRLTNININLLDFDVSTTIPYELLTSSMNFSEVSNYATLVVLFQCKTYLEEGTHTRTRIDSLTDLFRCFTQDLVSHIIPRSSKSLSFSAENLYSFESWRYQTSKRIDDAEPHIEETELDGIDGYVVANGVTARVVIKDTLSDDEKLRGVQYLLEQSEHGRKAGVYMWCLDEDEAGMENESSTLTETGEETSSRL